MRHGARPGSPRRIGSMKQEELVRNGPLNQDRKAAFHKVHRIALDRTAVVKVLRAESPSSMWLRLTNHTTYTDMIVRPPCDLKKLVAGYLPTDLLYRYCLVPVDVPTETGEMAPIDEASAYGRGRIIEVRASSQPPLVRVLLIDEGEAVWCDPHCLADINHSDKARLTYFPWQAIYASLAGVEPQVCLDDLDSEEEKKEEEEEKEGQEMQAKEPLWSLEECAVFREILSQFESIKVRCALAAEARNDYGVSIKVEMYGLHADRMDDDAPSIAHLFMAAINPTINRCISYTPEKADDVKTYEHEGEDPEPYVAPFRRKWVDQKTWSSKMRPVINVKCGWEYDPKEKHYQIPIVEGAELWNEYCDRDDTVYLSIEGQHTRTPYEFYGRAIKRERREREGGDGENGSRHNETMDGDDVAAMVAANDELIVWKNSLDVFYQRKLNRVPLDKEQCETWLSAGLRVYAICAANDERAEYTGKFQRVEVLAAGDFMDVRFLDSGGTEVVQATNLFAIHRMHCVRRPLCLQLAVAHLMDANSTKNRSKEWVAETAARFKHLLREDVPVSVVVIGRVSDLDGVALSEEAVKSRPFLRPNTIWVHSIIPQISHQKNRPIEELLCEERVWRAKMQPGEPMPDKLLGIE